MSKPDDVFLCGRGPHPMVPISEWDGLTKAEKKLILNYQAYLRGKGRRCTVCLHKADKHLEACTANGCECGISEEEVLNLRARGKAPGYERD